MGYARAKWHSGLTYRQVCSKCNTTIEYTDEKLGFRYWFPDGFVYCPNRKCKTPLRHSEEFAIDAKTEEPAPVVEETPAPVVEETPAPVVEETPAPVVEEAPAPVVEETPAPVVEEEPAPVEEEEPVAAPAGKKAVEAPFCTKCGTPFDAGECFCAMCGAKRAIKYI